MGESASLDDDVTEDNGVASQVASQGKKAAKAQPTKTYREFESEYAKSGRSLCQKCKEKIAKDDLRFAIQVDHDEVSEG